MSLSKNEQLYYLSLEVCNWQVGMTGCMIWIFSKPIGSKSLKQFTANIYLFKITLVFYNVLNVNAHLEFYSWVTVKSSKVLTLLFKFVLLAQSILNHLLLAWWCTFTMDIFQCSLTVQPQLQFFTVFQNPLLEYLYICSVLLLSCKSL